MAEWDIPNWVTMVIELTIGGIVAGIFFWIQHNQSNKINKIWTMRHDESSSLIKKHANLTSLYLRDLLELYQNFLVSKNKEFEDLIYSKQQIIQNEIKSLNSLLDESYDVITPDLKNRIEALISRIQEIFNQHDPQLKLALLRMHNTRGLLDSNY